MASGKLEPVITQYPKCEECNHAFILKLVMVMDRNHAGTGKTLCYMDFMWARDCKHKKAGVTIVQHELPQPAPTPAAKKGKKKG